LKWGSLSKIAKHILAFSNSGGGCIIFGINQLKDGSLEAVGLDNITDKSEVENGVSNFLPQGLEYQVLDFTYTESEYDNIKGKRFQVLMIEDAPEYIPFISKKDGEGINKDAIYVRKGTSSKKATYEEIQAMINRRLETRYSSTSELELEEHLIQLKVLYKHIDKHHLQGGIAKVVGDLFNASIMTGQKVPNPTYPKEDFEDFISRVIEVKKNRIERVLDIQ